MNKIKLDLGERSYDILVGKNSIKYLADFLEKNNYSKIFLLADENAIKHHGSSVDKVLGDYQKIIIPSGEAVKSFHFLEKICEEILHKGIDRKSLIIAFGGGVVGDFAGFIASILLRGIDFVQIPTTLLSMVDSSVGGKVAINSKFGKNLIGSFYQPKLVICDLNFLSSLPSRQIKSGYGEIIKYGLIFDYDFFEYLEKNYQQIFNLDEDALKLAITRSCEIKAEIVGRDEKESNERALLNFGHTFGHVFEVETNYSGELFHGEAVALGIVMAAKMSFNLGMILENDFWRIKDHLDNCGFVTDYKMIRGNWNYDNLILHLYKDKKNEHRNLTFILLQEIGRAVIKKSVDLDEFKRVLLSF